VEVRSNIAPEPPNLPLLDALSSLVDKTDFSNTVLVGLQHLQASNVSHTSFSLARE
jgi:hypothetical protein